MTNARRQAFHFSPSENHRDMMDRTPPALRYRGGDVREWQRRLRAKVRACLGEWPRERVALNPRRVWQRNHPLGRIEKVVFTSERSCDVPAYVCLPALRREPACPTLCGAGRQAGLPKKVAPPYDFVICLQGHSSGMHNSIGVRQDDETRPLAADGDRDFAIGCMKRGLAALCIEQRAFGERADRKQKSIASFSGCHDAAMHALMLGRTLIGERVYDVDRALDYLAWRGDADMRRVGVMGNSGGGTVTLFSAAMLPRIAFAMPSCYFCTFRDSIMSLFHCMDNYVPGLLRYAEMADVLGLFAPKPVVVVAGKTDDIFPYRGVREGFRQLKRIYTARGAGDRCHLVTGTGGHRFYADQAWPVLLRELRRLR